MYWYNKKPNPFRFPCKTFVCISHIFCTCCTVNIYYLPGFDLFFITYLYNLFSILSLPPSWVETLYSTPCSEASTMLGLSVMGETTVRNRAAQLGKLWLFILNFTIFIREGKARYIELNVVEYFLMYYARNVFMNTVFCFYILVPKYLKFAAFLKDLLAIVCYDCPAFCR